MNVEILLKHLSDESTDLSEVDPPNYYVVDIKRSDDAGLSKAEVLSVIDALQEIVNGNPPMDESTSSIFVPNTTNHYSVH